MPQIFLLFAPLRQKIDPNVLLFTSDIRVTRIISQFDSIQNNAVSNGDDLPSISIDIFNKDKKKDDKKNLPNIQKLKITDSPGCSTSNKASVPPEETQSQSKECPICLDEYSNIRKGMKIQCGHEFHEDCLSMCIFNGNNRCPLCRREIKL